MTPDFALQHDPLAVQVGQHTTQIASLHENQQRQDNSLVRIEGKIDAQNDRFLWVLVGIAGTLIAALGSLVATIITKHP